MSRSQFFERLSVWFMFAAVGGVLLQSSHMGWMIVATSAFNLALVLVRYFSQEEPKGTG